jgi:hypothetical protein
LFGDELYPCIAKQQSVGLKAVGDLQFWWCGGSYDGEGVSIILHGQN